MSKDQSVPH
jgi:hypothetical protein